MTNGPFYPLGRGEEISEGERAMLDADPFEQKHDEDESSHGWPSHLNTPEGSWQTREETVVAIADMTDTHLRNAIRWMKIQTLHDHPKFDELRTEATRRKIYNAP